uniref:Guanine nucleotide-binding protein subunit gamma n=1 Tax=Equus caballus TaxID=9796 RepID=F6T6I4_HORSE
MGNDGSLGEKRKFSCFCCCVRYFQLQHPTRWDTHLRRFWCTPLTLLPRAAAACGLRMKGETPVNSTMSIGQARKMVEQLKIEASLCRIKVSKAAADLMTYCDAHACEDPLITPVPTSENPFREKKFFCALL